MKRITKILFTYTLLPLAACKLSAKSVARDSIRPYSPYTFREKENYPKTAGYWYIGTGYSVPFMLGDMGSLTDKHDFWGNKASLRPGYKFSPFFGIEMGVSVGRMRGFSSRSAENFRLGTEDAMTYYPYTVLGEKDNYQTAPNNAGIWENQGNNVYIKSVPYSQIYSESHYWEVSLQAVFNFSRLFGYVPEGREQPISLLVKSEIYLQRFHAQAHSLSDKSRISPKQRPLSIGLGGDLAVHFALTQKLGLGISSGLMWVNRREFDSIRTIRHNRDDLIWQNDVSLSWKFCRSKPQFHSTPTAIEVLPTAILLTNPFSNGEFAFDYPQSDTVIRKEYSLSRQAHSYLPVSKWDIRPELGDNLKELGKITIAFQELTNDEDIYISSISIDGYASPEGPHDFNILLSQNHTEAIASHVIKNFNYSESQIQSRGHTEDWNELERLLQAWENPEKERALAILRSDVDVETRQDKLAHLSAYRSMLNELYPQLKRNEYAFHYTIAPFTIERITRLIYTQPEKLGVEEMIAVINCYPMYSEAFNEYAGIAFKFYPEAPIACIYMAAIALHRNDTSMATAYLSQLLGDYRAWNLLGVCAALENNPTKASHYLHMAVGKGDTAAIANQKRLGSR